MDKNDTHPSENKHLESDRRDRSWSLSVRSYFLKAKQKNRKGNQKVGKRKDKNYLFLREHIFLWELFQINLIIFKIFYFSSNVYICSRHIVIKMM